MSTLTSLARAHAVQCGYAQPITTVRHLHISRRPLALAMLGMAGEANAPLAAMVGDDRKKPRLLIVPQPRNRDQRFEFAQSLALVMLHYVETFASTIKEPDDKPRVADAPQLWVPNHDNIEFLRLFGRSTRFRSTTGPYAVPESVPTLGRWLTFFAERAEYPGSSLLVAATDALTQHWATGQSAIEDRKLASLLSWIAPPPGSDGAQAALEAEDPLRCPPTGPATDPTFDREVLAPAIARYDRASGDPRQRQRAVTRLETALRGQLEPTWQLIWRAIDQLRQLPPGRHVTTRWNQDKNAYLQFHTRIAGGGHPQPKRDSAVAAAIRLNQLEQHQAEYDAQRAFDDPIVMAEYRLTGDAFAGTVTSATPDRRVGTGRSAALRPLITVVTRDPVRLFPGEATVTDRARPKQNAKIVDINEAPDGLEITLELAGGMGHGRTSAPLGTMPTAGDWVCYSILTGDHTLRGDFPAQENTPWTHGGPPAQQPVSTSDDVKEEWS
jgi:hypothetical protein